VYDRVICTEIGTKKKFQNRIRPQATLVNICPVPYYEIMLAALFSRGRVPITGFLRFFRSATTAVICCGTITVTLYLSSCTTAMLPRFLSTEHQKHFTKILSKLHTNKNVKLSKFLYILHLACKITSREHWSVHVIDLLCLLHVNRE